MNIYPQGNNSDAVQVAMDNCGDHDAVILSAGLYDMSKPLIRNRGSLTMKGKGRTATRFVTDKDMPMLVFSTSTGGHYYTDLSSFGFENRCQNRTGSSMGIRIVGGNVFRRYTFSDLHFRGTYHGIRISGDNTHAAWGLINKCLFDNYGPSVHETGISVANNTARFGQTEFTNNSFMARYGMYIQAIFGDSQIGNNNFDCEVSNIHIDVSGASNSSFSIVNNELDVAQQPVFIKGANNFQVIGNSYLGPETPYIGHEDHVKIVDCSNYTVDVCRNGTGGTSGKTWLRGGMEACDGAWISSRDSGSKDERMGHFIARGKTNKHQLMSMGYDTVCDEGWLQSCHYGKVATTLRIQPNGGGATIGNPAGGGMGRGTLNVSALYVNGKKIA